MVYLWATGLVVLNTAWLALNLLGDALRDILGPDKAKWVLFLLAIAAFPPVCFSAFIAANSFRTTLPKVNPFISVGIGTTVSVILAITGVVAKAISVCQCSCQPPISCPLVNCQVLCLFAKQRHHVPNYLLLRSNQLALCYQLAQ